ncbi:MAG: hypothetical protein KJ630_12240 [Proteobacteria bacterium]|nr:hypothetical protein [Pseudomonadota bacterium]
MVGRIISSALLVSEKSPATVGIAALLDFRPLRFSITAKLQSIHPQLSDGFSLVNRDYPYYNQDLI